MSTKGESVFEYAVADRLNIVISRVISVIHK